jgi:nicotine blue oxidoreductase
MIRRSGEVSGLALVVLAAGEASRFGAAKQRLLLPEVLARLADAPVDEVVVVAGAYELDPASDDVLHERPIRFVRCQEWKRGPGASLRCGLAALGRRTEAAVVALADGPDVSPRAVARVVEVWRAGGDAVVAASYGGVRGHPLVIAREVWEDVPDEGLRTWKLTLVPCDDLGAPGDVDTPADLPERLR